MTSSLVKVFIPFFLCAPLATSIHFLTITWLAEQRTKEISFLEYAKNVYTILTYYDSMPVLMKVPQIPVPCAQTLSYSTEYLIIFHYYY